MKLLYIEPTLIKEDVIIECKTAIEDLPLADSPVSETQDIHFYEKLDRAYDILFEEVISKNELWKSQNQ